MLTEYVDSLQQRCIALLLEGRPYDQDVNPEYLISNKRKREKTLRKLVAMRYLRPGREPGMYYLTSQPFDDIEAEQPDIVSMALPPRARAYDEHDLDRRPGVAWGPLMRTMQKWILGNPDNYRIFTFDPSWPQADRKYFVPGKVDNNPYRCLYVTDDTFDAEHARLSYNLRFEAARGRNLAWGLEDQDLIEAVDSDVFETSEGNAPFEHASAFHQDPEQWETEMRKAIVRNREHIAMLTRATNIMCAVQNSLQARSGWKGFFKRYDAALHAELKKDVKKE